jgi:hypothetical protein
MAFFVTQHLSQLWRSIRPRFDIARMWLLPCSFSRAIQWINMRKCVGLRRCSCKRVDLLGWHEIYITPQFHPHESTRAESSRPPDPAFERAGRTSQLLASSSIWRLEKERNLSNNSWCPGSELHGQNTVGPGRSDLIRTGIVCSYANSVLGTDSSNFWSWAISQS